MSERYDRNGQPIISDPAKEAVVAVAALTIGTMVYRFEPKPPCVRCAQQHGSKPCRRKRA